MFFPGGNRRGDAARRFDMVVLDQHGVEQAEAVIGSAALANRHLVQNPEPRNGFSRVINFCFRFADGIHVGGGQGRNAAHALEKIQRRALGLQDGGQSAFHPREDRAFPHPAPVGDHFPDDDVRILTLKHRFKNLQTRNNKILFGHRNRPALLFRTDGGLRGDVARADVLGQGGPDDFLNSGIDHFRLTFQPTQTPEGRL